MAGIANSILEFIGNTALVRLRAMETPGSAQLLAKMENLNPGGSVKDRVALAMIEDGEAQGVLRPGSTIVEPSGGNMGTAMAMVATAKGYSLTIVLPENVPLERRRHIESFGATVQLTSSHLGMEGANEMARRLLENNQDFVSLDQFRNPANPRAHREGTGREILDATQGQVHAFVAGVGTGGTLTGVSEVLKEAIPSALVVAVEPATSPLLSEGWSGTHGIPGIGADFVPPILNRAIIDEVVTVTTLDAVDITMRLSRELGLLVGTSSGANVFAAMHVAQRLGEGKVVVTILPDAGERYLNRPL